MRICIVFFFFQAEDGIRDGRVTGVQTCALPISTPGTTIRCPCGNWLTMAAAFATGVRRSKPPLTATIGTFGNGPAPSGVLPAGEGHSRQRDAVPRRAAQLPNGPNEPAG